MTAGSCSVAIRRSRPPQCGHAGAAVRIAEAADHPWTLYQALFDLGRAHLRRGDLPRATQVLERGLDLCRMWQIVVGIPQVAATLGVAYALAGRADEALPLVAGGVEEFRGRQIHIRPALIHLCAGMTCLSAGRIDEAASHAREALALGGQRMSSSKVRRVDFGDCGPPQRPKSHRTSRP